jgi:hypothetical protein
MIPPVKVSMELELCIKRDIDGHTICVDNILGKSLLSKNLHLAHVTPLISFQSISPSSSSID